MCNKGAICAEEVEKVVDCWECSNIPVDDSTSEKSCVSCKHSINEDADLPFEAVDSVGCKRIFGRVYSAEEGIAMCYKYSINGTASYLEEGLKCPLCGGQAELDDIEWQFKGCQDECWVCPQCHHGLFVKVRYGRVCSVKDQGSTL